MTGRCFYVSWIDLRTDPWPQWETLRSGQAAGGLPLRFLRADHAEWPGVPLLDQPEPAAVDDPRMGRLVLPGIPLLVDGRAGRLYTGPTLTALFHPGSRFRNLESLHAVYLLYQPEQANSPHEVLREVLLRLGAARGIKDLAKRVHLVPLPGIADPTDHAAIIAAIQRWLTHDDPFELGRAARKPAQIVVNLSPGTPSMHAAWLMLRWNGALGGAESVVEFVQGDGGLAQRFANEAQPPNPLRTVPIDALSQFVQRDAGAKSPPTPTPDSLAPEDWNCAPFIDLRQRIDHAAMLGLPILLEGERGTGKTFMAHYYHRRRRLYHTQPAEPAVVNRRPSKEEPRQERFPEKTGAGDFIGVTLSEFADIDTLRDTLFGWAKGSWTGADKRFDGLLGEAHGGTLFLDEIHHLARPLQAALLGPLNSRRYRPKMATYELVSHFGLVVATNDPQWRERMADDFRDRIERIVLEMPSFRSFQRHSADLLWKFWDHTLQRRCQECGIEYTSEGAGWTECRNQLGNLFRLHPLTGNWRDLQRLADNVLLHLTSSRDGRPSPLRWECDKLDHAIAETFAER